jgi:hypothetical protein
LSAVTGGLDRLRASPLTAALTSTWLLGALITLATWRAIPVPVPVEGLDSSWRLALETATGEGLDFGSGLAFTYGPLGFLESPLLIEPELAIVGFGYQVTLQLAFSATLLYAVRRWLALPLAFGAAYLTAAMTPDPIVPLALVWAILAVSGELPATIRRAFPFAAGALGAIELLLKLNNGILVVALAVIALVAMDERRRVHDALAFGATLVVGLVVLWASTGQGLGAASDFVSASIEFLSGYSTAMANEATVHPARHALAAAGLAAIAIAAALVGGRGMARTQRAGLLVLVATMLFVVWKSGFVRHTAGRDSYVVAVTMATLLAFGWLGRERHVAVAALVASAVAYFPMVGIPLGEVFRPLTRAEEAFEDGRDTLDPGRRRDAVDAARVRTEDFYRLDRRSRELLRGETVHVHPWETTLAWTYGLEWEPLPIFQSYAAYTSELDERNAERLRSLEGPSRILVHGQAWPGVFGEEAVRALSRAELQARNVVSIDGRYLPYDQPAATLEMLCNFEALRTTRLFQVLGRVPDRCGEPRLLGAVTAENAAPVPIPRTGPDADVVFARVEGLEPSGIERLRAFLYRPTYRRVTFDSNRSYRLNPLVAPDGLILAVRRRVDFPRPFALSTDARTVAFSQDSAFMSATGEAEIEFYAVAVEAPARNSDAG